jgi:hypothetical protein
VLTEEEIEQAVEERRLWLVDQLSTAAEKVDVELLGADIVNTYDMRSAGAVARFNDEKVWLRMVLEDPDYQPACQWDGNVTANAITGVPKPDVLRWEDWHNQTPYLQGRRLRAEVMTLVSGKAIASDAVLLSDPMLPDQWWSDLTDAFAAISAHPAPEVDAVDTVGFLIRGVEREFGQKLDPDLSANLVWTTAHADLHWGNITGPPLSILDWETWRRAPAGYDAATLYCNSLLVPDVANRIRESFADILATRTGSVALLSATVRYLANVGGGSDADALEGPLRKLGDDLLASL